MNSLTKNIGIRGKLCFLSGLYVVGIVLFGAVAYSTMNQVKVNGPLYRDIEAGKDLVADILPPPMYIIEAYLNTHQLADEEDLAKVEQLTAKAKKLRTEYDDRFQVWSTTLPAGPLKASLLEAAHSHAMKFFEVFDGPFMTAVQTHDLDKARELAGGDLRKHFEAQRDAIAKTVELANERDLEVEAAADATISAGTWILLAICIGLAVSLSAFAAWLSRGIIRVVNQNVRSMEAAAKQDYSLRPTIQAGGELGRMNIALSTMLDSLTALEDVNSDYLGQVNAISKSNAVIEFTPEGTILTANDNFLNVLGYTLDEVKGRHHRMFLDAKDVASPDYAKLWQDLNSGVPRVGQFRRICKSGADLYIQGSYNPTYDRQGKLVKVIKYATDITAAKQLEQQIKQKAESDQQAAAEQRAKVDELLVVVNAMADGDFSRDVPNMGDDAVGQVAQGVGKAMESVRDVLQQVRELALTVGAGSSELASASEEIASGAQEQASSLEETAASLEEITSAVKQNTDNALQAQQLASSSRQTAEVGGGVVGDAVNAMTAINDASKKIAEIITTIDEIAFQTNLLALNAAVEAARAGEQGRGFAVVASEVRSLAQRSASAAREIKNLIQDSVSKVQNGTALVNKSGDTLKEIVNSVKRVADIVTEISAASTEQLTGIEQVNNAVSQMDRVTQTNAAQTEEMSGTSQGLLSHAEDLQALVSRFRLGENDNAPSTGRHTPAKSNTRQAAGAKRTSRPAPAPSSSSKTGTHPLNLISTGNSLTSTPGAFVEF